MGCDLLRFSCALCGSPAQANPTLVMTIPARSDRIERLPTQDAKREPICESCTRQLLGRFERERLPIPSMAHEPAVLHASDSAAMGMTLRAAKR
jgi:hypothetical protein